MRSRYGVVLGLLFLVDIFLQSYFRELGFGIANGGISFGLFPGFSIGFLVIVYAVFVAWIIKNRERVSTSLVMMAVGGLGNLVSRMVFGGVWDYIYFSGLGFWFNLSDVLITLGVVVYMWRYTRG